MRRDDRLASLLFASALVFAVTAWVYSKNAENEFCRCDDPEYLLQNPHVRDGLTLASVKWALADAGYAANWHPLTWMSHALDVTVAQKAGWDYLDRTCIEYGLREDPDIAYSGAFARFCHLENVAWHAANAVLLLWLIVLLTDGDRRSLLAAVFFALLWALHPLRVEVVAWVSERKELLSVFFMLLTTLAYVRGGENRWRRTNEFLFFYAFSLFAFVLALMAKPVAVSLPAVLFAWEWVIRRQTFRATCLRIAPFALLAAVTCVLTYVSQDEALTEGLRFPLPVRLACAVEAPVIYLRQTVWPVGLAFSYAMPTGLRDPHFFAGVGLLAAMAAACAWWLVRVLRGKDGSAGGLDLLSLAVAWAYVGLVPMLGFVKVGYQPHSDRYTYWVGCGVAAVCAMAFRRLAAVDWRAVCEAEVVPHFPKICRGGQVAACAVLLLLSAATAWRLSVWRTSKSLYEDTVAKTALESDASLLVDVLLAEGGESGRRAIEVARDVLSVRRSGYARAVLAYALAIAGDADVHVDYKTGKEEAFNEVMRLASYALEEVGYQRHDLAYAAVAMAEYRQRHYKKAYEYLKKAVDVGYKCTMRELSLKAVKEKADAEKPEKEDEKDVQGE